MLPDIASVRTECESIDVEEGTYRFFDELGRSLVPRFIAPVKRSSLLFGIKLVGGGNFELDMGPQDRSSFEASLANAVAIEPNRWFETIADLARYVAENVKQKPKRNASIAEHSVAEQALALDSPVSSFYSKLRGRVAQAKRYMAQ